eukprot:363218-Chlamydomonas_euryale.AAC.5
MVREVKESGRGGELNTGAAKHRCKRGVVQRKQPVRLRGRGRRGEGTKREGLARRQLEKSWGWRDFEGKAFLSANHSIRSRQIIQYVPGKSFNTFPANQGPGVSVNLPTPALSKIAAIPRHPHDPRVACSQLV